MTDIFKILGCVIAFGLAGTAQAQTDDPAPDAAEPAPEAETVEAPSQTAQEPTGPAPGQAFVAGTFSAWELRCVRQQDKIDRCQMYQLLRDETGSSVAEVTLFAIPPGGPAEAGASVITPLETLLTADLRMSVDGDKARVYPYSFCTTEGCVARLGFTPEEVLQFKRGVNATVTLVPALAPDKVVNLTMSLSGFTAAYAELRTRSGLE